MSEITKAGERAKIEALYKRKPDSQLSSSVFVAAPEEGLVSEEPLGSADTPKRPTGPLGDERDEREYYLDSDDDDLCFAPALKPDPPPAPPEGKARRVARRKSAKGEADDGASLAMSIFGLLKGQTGCSKNA